MKIDLEAHCADDLAVVNAARVSLDKRSAAMSESDEGLIFYLMKNRHGSPFEHGYFRFYVEAPIFVFREWHRHRVGHSYNEMSGRYTELQPVFYEPKTIRKQVGKPGAYSFEAIEDHWALDCISDAWRAAWSRYKWLLERGVAKEQARCVLPVGIYSKMIWSCNPRSLMHFLSLRTDPQAMQEIRELATEAEASFERLMPVVHAAFVAHGRRAP